VADTESFAETESSAEAVSFAETESPAEAASFAEAVSFVETVDRARVIVGVDGSEHALAAVRAAAAEARYRGQPLLIVHAFIWPSLHVNVGPVAPDMPSTGLRHHAENLLAEAVAEAVEAEPTVPVSSALVDGAAAPVLIAESRRGSLLVLGDRGLGAVSGLIVGSVAVHASAHAHCPVLVVRGAEPAGRSGPGSGSGSGPGSNSSSGLGPGSGSVSGLGPGSGSGEGARAGSGAGARGSGRSGGPVVVGVDGSETSGLAIGFAFAEASHRGVPLVPVLAWTDADVPDKHVVRFQEESRRTLSESLAGWPERYPDVVVRPELVHGNPKQVFVERSRTAQLVVLGARGRDTFTGLVLGSVSQSLLYHSACPVAVVRATLE
jgi:nucleotide-binding universal stress UspA family protein